MSTILIIDDEQALLDLLAKKLRTNGHEVFTANNGRQGVTLAREHQPDLILLDIMMPKMDGFEVCQAIRDEVICPILFLSARQAETDKIRGLSLGGDDYITKPFGMMEFLARVKAVLRRSGQKQGEKELHCGSLTILVERHEVQENGRLVELTLKEFEVLKYLVENKGIVLTRDQLLGHVWGYDFDGETRTVDVHIRRLREKIERNPAQPEFIFTKWGVGYYFTDKD